MKLSPQEIYDKVIAEGSSPRLAEMLALRAPPRALTDRELFAGVGSLAKQFDGAEDQLNKLVKLAKKRGFKPGVNDFYNPMLAAFPGDPEAFIPPTGGRNHMRRLAEKRQMSLDGAVTVKKPEYREPTPDIPLQESYIREKMAAMVAADPQAAKADKRELRSEVIRKHAGK